MDFGIATFDNTLLNGGGGGGGATNYDEKTSNTNSPKTRGSGFLKQERSDPVDPPEDDQETFIRSSKTARTDPFDPPDKTMTHPDLRSDSFLSVSVSVSAAGDGDGDGGAPPTNMLSFSSNSTTTTTTPAKNANQSSLFSFYQPPPAYIRNAAGIYAGFGSGGLQAGMHVPVSRYKGPFTPSQWMELEHQALIYKHMEANVPVPSHLLNPLRKPLNPFLFSGSSLTSYPPNSYGWGTFHLGFSGNTDPEPGRCRRTDGKKWRCSRDAVPDQKYCERHINRGRHRSRKPVEGQNGHAVSTTKVGPVPSSSSVPISTRGTPNNIPSAATINNQFNTLHHHRASSSETPIERTQETQAFSMISPTITLKSKEDSSSSIQTQLKPIEESSVYSSDKNPYTYSMNGRAFLDQDAQNQNPLRHFTDEWPKDQVDRSSVSWPEELKPDWTQLSMSIPMAASDFSSSSNSPTQEKLAVGPLGLSHEIDPAQKQASNWIPISWGSSMGGPLGEVLNRTSNGSSRNIRNAAESNHVVSEMWDLDGNYRLGSSPTGVLQKTTFVSLSNSSSGSSPRGGGGGGGGGGNKKGSGSLCDDMFLSTHASSSYFPPSL